MPGLTRKTPERKTPPGQHGATAKKPSQYGVRLMEKQKLRFNYGVTEHQLINYVKKARYEPSIAHKSNSKVTSMHQVWTCMFALAAAFCWHRWYPADQC